MSDHRARLTIAATALLAGAPTAAPAQSGALPDTACDYRRCALGIAPAWSGLRVVRGERETPVANLGFLWTADVSRAFGGEEARRHARRAVRLRRAGAVLTDAGLLLGGYTAARWAVRRELDGVDRALGAAGAASFALSVPLQFAADGALSRAVWWHNVRFTR